MLTEHQKARLLRYVDTTLPDILPKNCPKQKTCFYRAIAMKMAVEYFSLGQCMLVGGSASFLAVPDEMDDGQSPTHYSYVYEGWGHPLSLPEIHCWNFIKLLTGKVIMVDTTTQFLPELSKEAGLEWKTPIPPKVLWSETVKDLPYKWEYTPSPDAVTRLNLLRHLMEMSRV